MSTRFSWMARAALGMTVERGSRRLIINMQEEADEWLAVAVEGPVGASGVELLDDHGHKIVGRFDGLTLAIAAAEKFAEQWLNESQSTSPCDCDEI